MINILIPRRDPPSNCTLTTLVTMWVKVHQKVHQKQNPVEKSLQNMFMLYVRGRGLGKNANTILGEAMDGCGVT